MSTCMMVIGNEGSMMDHYVILEKLISLGLNFKAKMQMILVIRVV